MGPSGGLTSPGDGARDFRRAIGFAPSVRRIAALACLLVLACAPAAAVAAGPAATARALGQQMRWAGSASGALAVDLDTGAALYARRPGVARVPASVEKLYTTATALRVLGADGRLVTEVAADIAPDLSGRVVGNLYLRGGGDPTFGPNDIDELADQVQDAGVRTLTGRVLGDETAFDSRRGPPSSNYATSIWVGPLSALAYSRGLTGERRPYFQDDPARFAATVFARELRSRGIRLRGVGVGRTPPLAPAIAAWASPPMVELVRLTNVPSDNFGAEMLFKALGAQVLGAGTTAAGAAVVREELADLGIHPAIVDGSGLSRANRTSPRQVIDLLETMDGEAAFSGSLAVAGRTGTLARRMRGTAAQDRCRAKTGTLIAVSALAGYCTTTSGADVAFAILMNGVNPSGARALQDRMVGALAAYSP